ncbi:Putative sulfate transporter [Mycobacteroides abscessus subsp. abscessus]|nr:Putative sulfate transporter [Mycobacteroides abscessus subsp. abscessus]
MCATPSLALLENVGFTHWLPPEQVFPEEEKEFSATLRAVRYAQSRLEEEPPNPAANPEKLYYLV